MIMEYDFDSIFEFIDYLDHTPTNLDAWGCEELESMTGSYYFCKTHSLEEAKDFCKYGYHEDFERLVDLKLQLEKYIKASCVKNKQSHFYVGYAPDVKAYLEGNPLSMFHRENPKRNHIDIYYNSGVSWDTSTSSIFNRGAITLCIVEMLEKMGFSVGFHVFSMTEHKNQVHYSKFHLKKNGERLNIQKLYFPLCSPSFFRRLVFRLCEETPDIMHHWTDGYGFPAGDYTIRKMIDLKDDDIVICRPQEMGVKGYNLLDDANAMFDYINDSTSEKVEFEHFKELVK